MRTKPIIEIIRRYGLTSKRLNPKNRIKYEEALAIIKKYESSSLYIKDVIDNTRGHSHNNCHCGIPGCGQKIRYEYILAPKDEDYSPENEIVAGSTCVWPTLGMGELQKKEFFKLDSVIRDHYALLDWKEAHADIVEKLNRLKEVEIPYFRPFWQEIETAPLLQEDTDFIAGVDADAEIEKAEYNRRMKQVSNEEYEKARAYIPELREFYKDDHFVISLCDRAETLFHRRLTGNQYRWLKVSINRMWFAKNIKGTACDLTSKCVEIMTPLLERLNFKSSDFESIFRVEDFVKEANDKELKWAWVAYKCQKAIVK